MTTALLIIDMQVALLSGAHREKDVLDNVQSVIRSAREAEAPVVYIQHNHASFEPMMKGSPGWEMHPQLDRDPSDVLIEKEASDAFYETDLASTLGKLHISRLVVCGLMTEFCVDATARSALSHDFDVTLVSDAHTTGDSTLPAAQIIAHHNSVLPNVVHPSRRITAMPSSEVSFR